MAKKPLIGSVRPLSARGKRGGGQQGRGAGDQLPVAAGQATAVAAGGVPAGHDQFRAGRLAPRDQLEDQLGRMLEVGVDDDDPGRGGAGEALDHGAAQAAGRCGPVVQHHRERAVRRLLLDHLAGVVGGVVGEHHLGADAVRDGGADTGEQRGDVVGFVERRYDDRDMGGQRRHRASWGCGVCAGRWAPTWEVSSQSCRPVYSRHTARSAAAARTTAYTGPPATSLT